MTSSRQPVSTEKSPRPRTVLLVDDDPDFLLIHEKLLSNAGYLVLKAATGSAGLDLIRKHRPDLVLHDIDLPDGNGLDLCRRIKNEAAVADTHILFVSGTKIAPEDKAAGLRAGADGYLLKPVHKEELLAHLQAILRNKQVEENLLYQAEVNRSLAEIAKTLTLSDSSLTDMAEVVLSYARRLTESEEGFVSSIDPATQDNVIHTFSAMMGQEHCKVDDKRIAFPRQEAGYPCLWGHCLNTREGFYTNEPAAHPSAAGLPEGHVPLRRFLSVPALYEGKLYGQIALANASRDYSDKDLNIIGAMAHLFAVSVFRKLSQEALRQSEEQYRMIVETANEGIRVQDTEGRITFVNQKMAHMLGKQPEDLLGRPVIESIHPDEIQDFHERIRLRREGVSEEYERRHVHADGSTIWTRISATPIFDDQGQFAGSFAMITDITNVKQAKAELIKAREQAEAASQAKSDFLANMSHEIRTPMNGVIGMTGLLLDTNLTPDQRRYVETIQSSGENLLALINDILDFSKIEAGHLEMETLDFNLHELLDDLSDTMALRAHEKSLELIAHAEPDVPELLRGDPSRLRQILNNLVGNAVKFTEAGEVVIRVQKVERDAGMPECWNAGIGKAVSGNRAAGQSDTPTVQPSDRPTVLLRFTVRDTGIGIPHEKIPLLFNKFSQVDASITRKFGGTGLGLAISRQLVELMGGEIGVTSIAGQGSEFWFTACFMEQDAAQHPTQKPLSELNGLRVLVVDDNTTNREVLCRQLETWRMRVMEADGGPAALLALDTADSADDPFVLAILDMQMPDMDGATLGHAIQQDQRFKDLPLVMLTSVGLPGDAQRFQEQGFSAYLNKPVRRSDLYDVLLVVLSRVCCSRSNQPIITRHLAREQKRREHCLPRLCGMVLVAEDNPVNQQVAVGILRKLGLATHVAANGLEALQALKTMPCDLVLMDVHMPEMDGLETTKRIRTQESEFSNQKSKSRDDASELQPSTFNIQRPQRLPIIAMTAGALREDREKCLEAGMDGYVTKPVNPYELGQILAQWLPARDRSQALPLPENAGGCLKIMGRDRPETDETVHTAIADVPPCPLVFDRESLQHVCMHDDDLAREVIALFSDSLPPRLAALKKGVQENDLQAVNAEAHGLKGSALNAGFPALAAAAGALEQAAKDSTRDMVESLLAKVEHEARQAQVVLHDQLKSPI